jgi:hypothetical protein
MDHTSNANDEGLGASTQSLAGSIVGMEIGAFMDEIPAPSYGPWEGHTREEEEDEEEEEEEEEDDEDDDDENDETIRADMLGHMFLQFAAGPGSLVAERLLSHAEQGWPNFLVEEEGAAHQ